MSMGRYNKNQRLTPLLKLLLTRSDFILSAIAATFLLATFYYWLLLRVSNLTTTVENISPEPVYFAVVKILVPATLILFGLNFALFLFLLRSGAKFSFKASGGSFLGGLVGGFAAACPICGAFLLSLVGVGAGLTALPFAGLEIWSASALIMGLTFFGSLRALDKNTCDPASVDLPVGKTGASCWRLPSIDKRHLVILAFLSLGLFGNLISMLISNEPSFRLTTRGLVEQVTGIDMNAKRELKGQVSTGNPLFDQVKAEVLPPGGITLPIRWGDWLPKLVSASVIDREKLEEAFAANGGLSEEQRKLLTSGSNEFIKIDEKNSWFLVTVFWPLGLANKTDINRASPIAGEDLFNFASTGGWTLGKAENGGEYFNNYEIVKLTAEQEKLVEKLGNNSFRPCCNNSTFYQDCNHGSALLGLLELGASQGLSKQELAKAALVANTFWFPHNYLQTALYLKVVKGIDWKDVNAEEVLGTDYSSATGARLVSQEVAAKNLIPENALGAKCGV